MMKKEIGKVRKINGEYWFLDSFFSNKEYSKEIADTLRKQGKKVRVIKTTFGVWGVYTHHSRGG